MNKFLLVIVLLFLHTTTYAATVPFHLSITGANINLSKSLKLSDIGEGINKIQFDFESDKGEKYTFDLNYKTLASNRSYPTNLDITLKDGNGKKLGYLFFAINNVNYLKQMGVFGLIVNVDGQPVDIKFTFDYNKKGNFSVANLEKERFVQDTLVPKFNFQMIRPVIVPQVSHGKRSVTYKLDNHPFAVNYTLKDLKNGLVQFEYNLYQTDNNQQQLLKRVYVQADSLATLREAMFAGKYFHETVGTFKLVFYPAMGQTEPK